METSVLMPKFGQTMEEGEIVKWRVSPGERIRKGEVLLEVATDKTVLEVESEYTGTLQEIIVPEGAMVPCGTEIARMNTE